MRIAFLLDSAAPHRRAVATIVCDADDLARRGHQVTVVADAELPNEGLTTAVVVGGVKGLFSLS